MVFTLHLLEAMGINFYRSFYYAKRSYLLTLPLSYVLIFLEAVIIPFAILFDLWALKFNRLGCNIVKNDFVSMKHIHTKNSDVHYQGMYASKELQQQLQKDLHTMVYDDFEQSLRVLVHMLQYVQQKERDLKVHFAMTKHILESVVFFVSHAIDYEKELPQSKTLSYTMLRFQLLALYSSLYIDRWAQHFHRRNIGILVNDLPEIEV